MQTFLPYPSFRRTAQCLDYRRLGKQRVEAWQILQALEDNNYGWQNHPAVKMWRNHNRLLCLYGLEICNEWIARGYKDTLREKFFINLVWYNSLGQRESLPHWYKNEQFHSSHRSALLYKDQDFYSKFEWKEEPELNYIWMEG